MSIQSFRKIVENNNSLNQDLPLKIGYFEDIPFHIENVNDSKNGRKGVFHTFPYRDTPYFEDMGRKAKEFDVTATIHGSDHLEIVDELRNIAATKSNGILNLPEHGINNVYIKNLNIKNNTSEDSITYLDIKFVEFGQFEDFSISGNIISSANSQRIFDEILEEEIIEEAISEVTDLDNVTGIILKDKVTSDIERLFDTGVFDEVIEYIKETNSVALKYKLIEHGIVISNEDLENKHPLILETRLSDMQYFIEQNEDDFKEQLEDGDNKTKYLYNLINRVRIDSGDLNDKEVINLTNPEPSLKIANNSFYEEDDFLNLNEQIVHPLFTLNDVAIV